MATDAENLAAIEAALARGVREVEYDEQTVKYQSRNEMVRARNELVAKVAGKKRRSKVRHVTL